MTSKDIESRLVELLREHHGLRLEELSTLVGATPSAIKQVLFWPKSAKFEYRDGVWMLAGASPRPVSHEHAAEIPRNRTRHDLVAAAPPAEVVSCKQIIESVLRTHGLEKPDGRPLYNYRLADAEFVLLVQRLREELRLGEGAIIGRYRSAGFCLCAATWWGRHFDGGHWTWSPIFEAIGKFPSTPVHLIYPVVEVGMDFWRQQVLVLNGQRRWLASIACQGGLPTKVLGKEGKKIPEFLKRTLLERQRFSRSDVSTRELARNNERFLPLSLRNEVFFELGASVTDAVAELLDFNPDPSDPVNDLDVRHPDWRRHLPLDLTDSEARHLLNLLVRTGVEARASSRRSGITVHTVLRLVDKEGEIQRHIALPRTVSGRAMEPLIGKCARDLPQRFELYRVASDGGKELLALGSRSGGTHEDPLFSLEATRSQEVEVRGREAVGEVALEITASRKPVQTISPPGGASLSEAPWVFAERDGELRLLAQGSIQTRDPHVFIALSGNTEMPRTEAAAVEDLGRTTIGDRQIVRLSGHLFVNAPDGSKFRIKTGAATDDFFEYIPVRPDLEDAKKQPLYRRFPLIQRFGDGVLRDRVPENELEWRPAGSGPWRSNASGALGRIDVRHAPAGETRFRERFTIVGEDFGVDLRPGADGQSGVAVLLGLPSAASVRLEHVPSLEGMVSRVEGKYQIELRAVGEPPVTMVVSVSLGNQRSFDLALPVPIKTARFLGRNGKVLGNSTPVSLDRLGGVRAQVLAPGQSGSYAVELGIQAAQGELVAHVTLGTQEPLVQVFPGCHELDLSRLRERLQLALTMTTDLDAKFEARIVAVWGTLNHMPRLGINRYEMGFRLDKEAGFVCLDVTESEVISVRAASLRSPELGLEELRTVSPGVWDFRPAERAPGPWILAGMEGEFCKVRPTLWFVPGAELDTSTPVSCDAFPEVCLHKVTGERRGLYAELLSKLTEQPDHPAWSYVQTVLENSWPLPACSQDVFVGISKCQDALPSLLLSLERERLLVAWDFFEQLPIFWHSISVRTWTSAVVNRARALLASLQSVSGLDPSQIKLMVAESLSGALCQLRHRLAALEIAFELANEKLKKEMPDLPVPMTSFLKQPVPIFRAAAENWRVCLKGTFDPTAPIERQFPLRWDGVLELAARLSATLKPPGDWLFLQGVPEYLWPLVAAPAVTAWASAYGLALDPEATYHLRRLRAFDPSGFDQAYTGQLGLAISHIRTHCPERLG